MSISDWSSDVSSSDVCWKQGTESTRCRASRTVCRGVRKSCDWGHRWRWKTVSYIILPLDGEAAKLANLFASCSGGGAVSACNDCATTRRHPHPTPPNRYAIRLRILPPSRGKGGGGLPCQHRSEL